MNPRYKSRGRARLRMHWRYLTYVLLHKWYVFRAGLRLGAPVWRLIVHDLSKLRPSEWLPYAEMFYGENPRRIIARLRAAEIAGGGANKTPDSQWEAAIRNERQSHFDYAWLLHIHRNPHHWQHWMLREDSGGMKVLLMPADVAREMVADWCGAGMKILNRPSLIACGVETARWYAANMEKIVIRGMTRQFVETLITDAATWGSPYLRAVAAAKIAQQENAALSTPPR